MSNQIDLNNFNSFLEKATQAISCDSNCQQQQATQQLKANYLNAQTNLSLAEPEFQLAQKNYYTYVSGESAYNELIETEFSQAADMISNKFKENYNVDVAKVNSQLDTYNAILINFRNVIDLYTKYKKENEILYKQFKENTNDILTNERKTYYEDQKIDSLNAYYYYILWIIYIVVLLCLIGFSLIYPSNLKTKIITIVLFIILPFIATWILGMLIYIAYWLFGLIPKNVYK